MRTQRPVSKPAASFTETSVVGERIGVIQRRLAAINARQTALLTETDKLDEEKDGLRSEHAALLRKFDSAAALPT